MSVARLFDDDLKKEKDMTAEQMEKEMEDDIVKSFGRMKLREEIWEGSECILTCNGVPVGMTVRRIQVERWWCEELWRVMARRIASELMEKSA